MSKPVSLRIDVSKIDKSRLYKGAKGTYLDMVVFLNEESDQYGNNGMITQSISKEERDKGVKGNILGNAKLFGSSPQPSQAPVAAGEAEDEDLPF